MIQHALALRAMGAKNGSVVERFWKKVAPGSVDVCWVWLGSRNRGGYGQIRGDNGDVERAHRVAWRLSSAVIPAGLHVLHRCDNPGCVNPNHLFLGTNDDNIADMVTKNRGGEWLRRQGRDCAHARSPQQH